MRTEPSFSSEPDDHVLDDGTRHPDNASGSSFDSESQLLSDYRQRYGLSIDPFADDPHFPFYTGAQRRQILDQLLHLCQFSHNLLVVTGEYGVGKTRMAQALIDTLDDVDDICFVEGQITSDINSLLAEVLAQFELTTQIELVEFCQKKSEQDGLVVLIIDNAHHLADEVISELVSLLQENLESRLHLVLFAEPYLLDRLESINAPDIVLTDFFLEKFSLAESVDYLNFRMEMADYLGPEIFVDTKVDPWWRESQGHLLLLHEKAQEKLLASVSTSRTNKSNKSNLLVPHIVATSLLASVLVIGYLYWGGDSKKKVVAQVAEPVPVATQPQLSAVSSQSASLQTSSIAAAPAVVATTEYKGAESVRSATSSLVSTPSELGAASEKVQIAPAVKQSVVPLVQTNEFHSLPAQKQVSSVSSVKEVKKTEVFSEPVKAVAKVKSENNNASTPKSVAAFSSQEKIILSWDPSEFTLQIVGVSNEKAALEFIAAQSNKKDLLLFRSIRQGKDWFVVVSGHYANSASARKAAQSLPESQLKSAPWPRDLKTIHREIKQRVQ